MTVLGGQMNRSPATIITIRNCCRNYSTTHNQVKRFTDRVLMALSDDRTLRSRSTMLLCPYSAAKWSPELP